ncbi:MAG: hypothetical protein C4326_01460 [Ignavibacteria bacterium]
MIRTIFDFEHMWSGELERTQKVFKHLTNDALTRVVHPDVRTLGRLARHIVTTIPEMASKMGLRTAGPQEHDPIPQTAKAIFIAYNDAAISLLDEIKKGWTDDTLSLVDAMYGQQWKRGASLHSMLLHQAHHRGEMIVLMRMCGLAVPGVYGPTRDEWAQWGMQPPAV